MQITVLKVHALVDGASVIATRDSAERIHFQWIGSVTDLVRTEAQDRLTRILRFETHL